MTAYPIFTQGVVSPATDDKLGYCLYRSLAGKDLDQDGLDELLERSRDRNQAKELTGCLHFENGTFFQWIEGPWRHVFRLIDALQLDDRHLNMTILDQGSLNQRLFPSWQMRFSDREAASLFDWLAGWGSRMDDAEAYAARVRLFLQSIAE